MPKARNIFLPSPIAFLEVDGFIISSLKYCWASSEGDPKCSSMETSGSSSLRVLLFQE